LPLIETSLFGNTYNQNNGNLKSMRVIQFIILAVVIGWSSLLAGCVAENDVDNDDLIVVCNVFTPNDDPGKTNNFFEVRSEKGNVVSLEIFTRAGALVFRIEAQKCVWDGYTLSGQPMPSGIYFYTAEVPDSSPKVSKSGFVYLYR